jgi:hypothetical protein
MHPVRRAGAVEMSCGLVSVEIIEDGCVCIAALEFLEWNIAVGVHVHNEMRVVGPAFCALLVGEMGTRVY